MPGLAGQGARSLTQIASDRVRSQCRDRDDQGEQRRGGLRLTGQVGSGLQFALSTSACRSPSTRERSGQGRCVRRWRAPEFKQAVQVKSHERHVATQTADDKHRRLDSVADLTALYAYLPKLGLDQRRAALWGGSYGGYMVLAGLAFQPELWAAGVNIVGIASLVTFLENTSAYRRAYREREYGTLKDDREFLRQVSPLTHIDNITAAIHHPWCERSAGAAERLSRSTPQ